MIGKSILLSTIVSTIAGLHVSARGQEAGINPHGDIKWDCQQCHSAESWNVLKKPIEFQHSSTGFALIGAHETVNCVNCHGDLKFAHVGVECADCHTDVHRNQFGAECGSCHTPHGWQNRQDLLELHASRGFPLVGVHSIVDCDACHIAQGRDEFAGTPIDCQGCHISSFTASTNPNHARAGFSDNCQSCHPAVSSSWRNTTFRHVGAFPMRGAHARIDCASCHQDIYAGTSTLCFDCHNADFQAAREPDHAAMGFPTNCEACHNETAWQGAQFDHLASTGFELVGTHASISCVDCHVDNQLNLPRECFGCHQQDYENVAQPNHVSGDFPQDCTICHGQVAWVPAQFDHNQTAFPLTGVHLTLACESCHANGQFSGTPTDCFSCHENDYNSVQDPNHVQNNFDTDCTRCHSTAGWIPSTFDHSQTQFPLTGAHTGLDCISCHAGGYQNVPTDCYSCHENDYNNVQDPSHVNNNFDTDCTLCHTTAGWSPAYFDHAQTHFPLTGAHVSLDCIACHAGGYQNVPTDCFSCHEDDYNNVQDPNHISNNFSTDCTICHTTAAWIPSSFDHSQTQFPLTGAHLSLECIACHAGGYQNVPTDCFSCHENDYNNVDDPNHVTNNFSTDCTQCHTTSGWTPVTFDHSQTQFPLTGAHVGLDCILCHADGYDNTPTDCFSCHESDYNNVQDPNHVADNFSTDCTQCHTTNGWYPVTFDHNTTGFPLTGAHLLLDCLACHGSGYDNTPSDCYACHVNDYNGAGDPNHLLYGFPTGCTLCHNTTSWDTNWNHDTQYFPIFSGRHQGRWNLCSECHVIPNDYAAFECIFCHEHNQQDTDDRHTDVPGYVYNSQACYTCHPDGEGP